MHAGNTNVVTAAMDEERVFGARLEPLSSSDMSDLDIDYGVKVIDLDDGKFKDIGMKKGYIILSRQWEKSKNSCRCKSNLPIMRRHSNQ